jgi:hypothetical protein
MLAKERQSTPEAMQKIRLSHSAYPVPRMVAAAASPPDGRIVPSCVAMPYSTKQRPFRLTSPLSEDVLLLDEALSRPFEFRLAIAEAGRAY